MKQYSGFFLFLLVTAFICTGLAGCSGRPRVNPHPVPKGSGEITVREINRAKPLDESVNKALDDDLSAWRYSELAEGPHPMESSQTVIYYVEEGKASLRSAGRAYTVQAGDAVTVPGGDLVEWNVDKAMKLRHCYRDGKELRRRLESLNARLSKLADKPETGAFVACPAAAPAFALFEDEKPATGEAGQPRALFISGGEGALTDSLFTLPEGAFSFRKLSVTFFTSICLQGLDPDSPEKALLKEAKAVDLLAQNGLIEDKEELFLSTKENLLRWKRDVKGMPLRDALFSQGIVKPKAGIAASADPETEERIELILSTLWGNDLPKEVRDYTNHPVKVPYNVDYLYLEDIASLSKKMKDRWAVRAICPYRHSLVSPFFTVRITGISDRKPYKNSHCTVTWCMGREYIKWEYGIDSRKGKPSVLYRRIIEQRD